MAANDSGVLRALERMLILGGFAALGWCAFVMVDAQMAQQHALSMLRRRPSIVRATEESAQRVFHRESLGVPRGAAVAELQIPRLHLVEAVLEGSDDGILRQGPGHIEHTSLPGQLGNVGVAGHRDTFFRPLRKLHLGDEILLSTTRGVFRYRVSSLQVVPPSDVEVLDPTSEPSLTLITCYPFWFVGPAPLRYVARAVRVASAICGHAVCGVSS